MYYCQYAWYLGWGDVIIIHPSACNFSDFIVISSDTGGNWCFSVKWKYGMFLIKIIEIIATLCIACYKKSNGKKCNLQMKLTKFLTTQFAYIANSNDIFILLKLPLKFKSIFSPSKCHWTIQIDRPMAHWYKFVHSNHSITSLMPSNFVKIYYVRVG